jgi:peptidoglycan/LPS O-acetylase OafA/YrhL
MIQAWFTTLWTYGVVVSPAWLRPDLAADLAASWRSLLVAGGLIAACAAAEYTLLCFYPNSIWNYWLVSFSRGPFGNFPYFLGSIFTVFSLLGEASYPLYMLQFPLEDWLSFTLPPLSFVGALTRLIVYSAISVLVAVCFERPARDFIRKRLVAADGSRLGR